MCRGFLALAFLLSLTAVPAFAEGESPVTRRDGFLLLWEGIRRPVGTAGEQPFSDVPADDPGYEVLRYVKARGLLDDGSFRPGDPLGMTDALVWLFRTRNVANPDELTSATIADWLRQYPLPVEVREYRVENIVPVRSRSGKRVTQRHQTLVHRRITEHPVTTSELQQIARTFDRLLAEEVHEASLYAEKFHGKGTAFGETFDMHALTAAHRTLPSNTLLRVTNVENGRSAVVRINDRGPYVEGRDLDLSLAAFASIADRAAGTIQVTYERLGDVSLINMPSAPCRKISRRSPRLARCR
ncbi:MAG: rare lipoprotein A [Candidatus Peregrinibacteria bacterium Greene0416_19]|nr:MAG: rare lipoprotein A [Candidatus Peregrinibacteria bacterium Greene0416_19]